MFPFLQQIKYNFSTAYAQPSSFFKTALSDSAYAFSEAAGRTIAKSVIHLARGAYDIVWDLANSADNLMHESQGQTVISAKQSVTADPKEESNPDDKYYTVKNFIINTWYEKDSTYLGQFSANSQDFPAVKTLVDLACLGQGITTAIWQELIAPAPSGISKVVASALEASYTAEVPTTADLGLLNCVVGYENEAEVLGNASSLAEVDLS